MKVEMAKEYIDMAASEARGRYISNGIGQESTYLMKAQQAREFQAAGYVGDPPTLIQAEMTATGQTAEECIAWILASEAQWAVLAGHIETIRRTGKITVASMTDPVEIADYCDTIIDSLNAI